MPDEEDMLDERIEMAEKERLTLIMLESAQRGHLDRFVNFELRPDNLREFMAMRMQATFDNVLTLNELENEKLEFFNIHPDFNSYFKSVMEKKDKKVDEEEHHQKWKGFLRQDWRDAFTQIMRKESQYQPRVALLVELLLRACEKYEAYIYSAVPSMHKAGMPSFGKGRTKIAYEMHLRGKPYKEIAAQLGIAESAVSQYIKIGSKSKKKEDDDMAEEETKEEPQEKKPEEAKEEEEQAQEEPAPAA